jgi:hypothetical protein
VISIDELATSFNGKRCNWIGAQRPHAAADPLARFDDVHCCSVLGKVASGHKAR